MTRFDLSMRSGKEKKKKKASSDSSLSSSSSASSSSSSSSRPMRVTSNSNVSVRQQIAWARACKRLASYTESSRRNQTTKRFRQVSDGKQSSVEDTVEDVDYSALRPPIVFIDGYNVIGAMEKSRNKDSSSLNIDLEEARDSLISDLSVLRAATGWDIQLVFDACRAAHIVSAGRTLESRLISEGVSVVYTSASETADTYIERQFQELLQIGYTNLVVVTDDQVLRSVAGEDHVPVLL